MLCFKALIVYRVMRHRLRLGKSELRLKRALAQLRHIQRHRVSIMRGQPLSGDPYRQQRNRPWDSPC